MHVNNAGLGERTPDRRIWEFAKENNFTIVTADADFLALARSFGAPPCVVRLEQCDYRTARVEALLRRNAILIAELPASGRAALLIRNS